MNLTAGEAIAACPNSTSAAKSTRLYGLDLFRILCCLGVLGYHILDDIMFSVPILWGKLPYFICSYCVPGFFMLSGFLLAEHGSFNEKNYFLRKIGSTMLKLFFWTVFIDLMFYGDPILPDFIGAFSSSGNMPVGWFIYTYCILLFMAKPFLKFNAAHPVGYIACVFVLLILIANGIGNYYIGPQALWIPLYLTHFLTGIALHTVYRKYIVKLNRKLCFLGFLIVHIISAVIYFYPVCQGAVTVPPSAFYGEWYYSIWLITLFLMCCFLSPKSEKVRTALKKMSANTLAVYLGHLALLSAITSVWPITNPLEAYALIGMLFLFWEVIGELFKKLPGLHYLM